MCALDISISLVNALLRMPLSQASKCVEGGQRGGGVVLAAVSGVTVFAPLMPADARVCMYVHAACGDVQ